MVLIDAACRVDLREALFWPAFSEIDQARGRKLSADLAWLNSRRSVLAFWFFEGYEVDAPNSVAGDDPLIVVEGTA